MSKKFPLRFLHLAWLIPLWFFQYPTIFSYYYMLYSLKIIWGVFRFALQIGVLGLILLCIPFIGWIILAFWYLNRPNIPKPYRPPSNIFKPLFIELIRSHN